VIYLCKLPAFSDLHEKLERHGSAPVPFYLPSLILPISGIITGRLGLLLMSFLRNELGLPLRLRGLDNIFEPGVERLTRGDFRYCATIARMASRRTDDTCVFAIADLLVIDLRINPARAGTQTHMDFIAPSMGQGWEPMPTMMISAATKRAKRRMG